MSVIGLKRFLLLTGCVVLAMSGLAYAEGRRADPSLNFLALADIHFDPYVTCYRQAAKPCSTLARLRAAPASQWPQILAEVDHGEPGYRQDTNYLLLQNTLGEASRAALKRDVDFVLVLGDTLGHDFRHYYRKFSADDSESGFQAFAKKTLEFLNRELSEAFPGINVFMVTGNNDTYSPDYQSVPAGNFFRDMASVWSTLIQNPKDRATMRSEFSRVGYYALTIPDHPSLRLVVLNSVLFSEKSRGKRSAAAADAQLDWLHEQLQQAKDQQQQVLLALHIPPRVDAYATRRWRLFTVQQFWRAQYLQRFQEEMAEFYPEIVDIIAGHLHYDWVQSLDVDRHRELTVYGVPSVSPIFGNDPGFKIYHYAPAVRRIDSFYTYDYSVVGSRAWSVLHAIE